MFFLKNNLNRQIYKPSITLICFDKSVIHFGYWKNIKKKPKIGGYFILSTNSWLGNHPVWKAPMVSSSEANLNNNLNFR